VISLQSIIVAKKFNPFVNSFLQQTANSSCSCTEMAITMDVGVRNVCLSRCRKIEQVIFRLCIQALGRFIQLVAQKSDQTPVLLVCPESVLQRNLI
jgi:hypothetical protein